jgi:hypothetical protein
MPVAANLIGQRFGRLLVVVRIGSRWGKSLWRCLCDCGAIVEASASTLKNGKIVSCGCARTKHGHSKHNGRPSQTYNSWHGMVQRCTLPTHFAFADYGGVGIFVCERWLTFANFLADMGERPPGTSIDRFPDRDGGYEPGNCRWATPHEQTVNRSATKLTGDLVQEIHGRREHGEAIASIAERMPVSSTHVRQILNGKKWRSSIHGHA